MCKFRANVRELWITLNSRAILCRLGSLAKDALALNRPDRDRDVNDTIRVSLDTAIKFFNQLDGRETSLMPSMSDVAEL